MAVPVIGKVEEVKTFVEECVTELHKVTWPDYAQLKNATIVVLVFVAALSVVIWLMDVTVRTLIGAIMGMFGA
ncbi:MAG: preprotein translocase subunit SecE [Gemmatimonadetes bacterium]|nr:preprotein translocase subunit SecE [Gemmatimonadota bacterium]